MSLNAQGQENKLTPAYDDLTPMWFGKHKGELLQDVPASYFSWLWWDAGYRDHKDVTLSEAKKVADTKLANYIWNSRNAINIELKGRDVRPIE